MIAFDEVGLPDDVADGAGGDPEGATSVVVTGAGHEQRNVDWAEAHGRWDVASRLEIQLQLDVLVRFGSDHVAITTESLRLHRCRQIPIAALRA